MFMGWQIFVCVSLVGAGFVSKRALQIVSVCWVAWTLFAVLPVYAPWVGVFQLVNIGVSFSVMKAKNSGI